MKIVGRILAVLVVLVAGLAAFDHFAPYQAARLALDLEQGRAGLHEARASIPGFDIAYLDGGAGEPLLLIHGFGADKNNFTRTARFLTPRYRVLIPDLPGFGDSSRPDGATYTIAEQVERLRAFAHGLGVTRLHLGGNSMGGWIAAAWAAKYPEEVASLWLLDAAGTKAAFDSELRHRYDQTGEILLVAKDLEQFDALGHFVMSQPPWLPYSMRRVLSDRAAADYALHVRIFRAVDTEPLLETWARDVPTPALIVWGDEDRALSPKGADALKAIFPKAKIIRLPGIGHLPMIEAVDRSAADYLAFRDALNGT